MTALERLWDALERLCPLWDLAVIYGALAAVLVAHVVRIVEVLR